MNSIIIDEYLQLLYDFTILKSTKDNLPDPREEKVRVVLERCATETAMYNIVKDLIVGRTTLADLLGKEVM